MGFLEKKIRKDIIDSEEVVESVKRIFDKNKISDYPSNFDIDFYNTLAHYGYMDEHEFENLKLGLKVGDYLIYEDPKTKTISQIRVQGTIEIRIAQFHYHG